MPFSDPCVIRSTGFDIEGTVTEGGANRIVQSATLTYRVVASGFTNPQYIDDMVVACAVGLPTVNRSTYYNPLSGLGLPTAVCRSKSVTRLPENANVFEVECEFRTQELEAEECATAPPANLTDITPQVRSRISSYERVMYADKNGTQCWKLPGTETPFSTPVTETIPVFQLEITQFESAVTFEQQIERSFKTNLNTYRSKAAGLWQIGAVEMVNQEVQLSGGPTTAVRVTYPITLSERFYFPPGSPATPANAIVYGHDHIQPLVDTMYKTLAPVVKVVPNLDPESGTVIAGYINSDGTERTVSGPDDDRPDYLRFRSQDRIDFSTFLQV